MKRFLSFFFLSIFLSIKSQSLDSIIYVLPDSVEIKIYEQIKDNPELNYYFYLTRNSGLYRIFKGIIGPYEDFKVANTNRFLLINKWKYPIYTHYDIQFGLSSKEETKIGEFGNRFGGGVKCSYTSFCGYFIDFDRFGENIKESHGVFSGFSGSVSN